MKEIYTNTNIINFITIIIVIMIVSSIFIIINNSIQVIKAKVKLKKIIPEKYLENITRENVITKQQDIIEYITASDKLSEIDKKWMKAYIERDSISELIRILIELKQ